MKSALMKVLLALLLLTNAAFAADPLPSWNDGPTKQGIISFVDKVTKEGSPTFVPPAERIATFDNDGTLWCEQPLPVQLYFALDRVKALAPQHPEWKTKEPFASLLKGDLKTALAGGDRALLEIVKATHTGMTTVEFEQIVKDWIATAKHPKTGKLYTEMVYQPMLEMLSYLRQTVSRTSSSPAAASNSCGRGRKRSMASRPSRSSAAASRQSLKCVTASPSSCVCRS
jgi:hypothetical protein